MKKYLIFLLLIGLTFALLLGCNVNEEQPNGDKQPDETNINKTVTLYFGDENNEKFVTEEREITFSKDEDEYTVLLEELIKGPENENYRNNINMDTKVYGTIKQDNDLVVNLSKEFAQFSGSIAEIIGVGSVVNSLTELDGIERVKILIEGEELIGPSGNPRGFMGPIENNKANGTETRKATLYFGNKDATKVKPEERMIIVNANISREDYLKMVLEELIKGPKNNDLNRTIPNEVRVLSVRIEKDIAYVDFSEEMHTMHWGGATGEGITISSIVSTVTELYDIDKVMMTVSGQPMSIEHAILDEPVSRNEDMIEK